MIKKIIKFLLIVFFVLVIVIVYLSIFGIKTDKFNSKISSNILKINKKINLKLTDVNYLLNPYNFTINVKTKNPKLLLQGKILRIKDIQTNVPLKSLINNEFSLNDLQIRTEEIKFNDVITLLRIFQNSPKLFVLDTVIKEGYVTAKINLSFDDRGKIKQNYNITGSVRKIKINILNQLKLKNLNFNFNIDKNIYLFKNIETQTNNIELFSPLVEVKKKKNSFFVNGQLLNKKQNLDFEEINLTFNNKFNYKNVKKIEFSSKNNFSFNVNKKLKFDNLKVESNVNLSELIINQKDLKLKPYFPNFSEEINLKDHNITISYYKNKFNIKGNGNILLQDKSDNLSYEIINDDNNILFESKINIKNNSLLISLLDYEKKEGSDSSILFKGNFKKNDKLKFDLISLKDKSNEILIRDLELSKNFKITDIKNFYISYKNKKKIFNKINLKKDKSNFIIEGESFDATQLINRVMDSDNESVSIFENLNSKINIKIKKTYIDETNYMNNLQGYINFDNNKINDLRLESVFPNKNKINLLIKTNNNSEIITKLSTSYPKPLVKRYDFIKGFEEGNLNFYSTKKGDISNSVLVIDNFKVKEVPIFAKLLTLASLQGMADLLTGEGIRFTDFEMNFSNKKGLTTIEEMYAIGPAVSILMDGYIEPNKLVSLRGTLVPATTINRSIASIPLLGKILIGDKTGEGVFGVSFKIKGKPKKLKTSVNPIKTLTPRFITRTLEKIKKN
jgi:hypothetical protein